MRSYKASKSWIRKDAYLPSILLQLSHLQTLHISGRVSNWLDWSAWDFQLQTAISRVLQQGSITGIKLFALRNIPANTFSQCKNLDRLYLQFVGLAWRQGQTSVVPRQGFFSDLAVLEYTQEWRLLREEFGNVQIGRYRTQFNLTSPPLSTTSPEGNTDEQMEALKRYIPKVHRLGLAFSTIWPSNDPHFAESLPLVGLLQSALNLTWFDVSSQINHVDNTGRTLTLLWALDVIIDRLPPSVTRLDAIFHYVLPFLKQSRPPSGDVLAAWAEVADRLRWKSDQCQVYVRFDVRLNEGVSPLGSKEESRAMEAVREVKDVFCVLADQSGVHVDWEYNAERLMLL